MFEFHYEHSLQYTSVEHFVHFISMFVTFFPPGLHGYTRVASRTCAERSQRMATSEKCREGSHDRIYVYMIITPYLNAVTT